MVNRPPTTTLIIVGNSPGEVAGWAVPVAAEARRLASVGGWSIETVLCLPPCQFASGQESAAAEAAGVFDRIMNPRATLLLALGLPGWTPAGTPVVLHVGGDFWFSRRLARRWGGHAFAFVERAHISRAQRGFERIFVPTTSLRERLIGLGVPDHKIEVAGDPLQDAVLADGAPAEARGADDARPKVALLAGSRDSVFSAVFPFWVETAAALRARVPEARLLAVVSPFVSPSVKRTLLSRHQASLDAAGVEIRHGGRSSIRSADLALTIPGTNTLELALMRVPTLVVLPFSLAPQIPVEGVIEWLTRVPRLGLALKLALARRHISRRPYLALPNMRAKRLIMPELVGDVTPEQVADEGARLIRDRAARLKLAEALEAIPVEPGASRRILAAIAPGGAAIAPGGAGA
ncbi:MAG: hypothetical protein QME77_01860 [bacterium]|nr:hypothetical protein [bacterium]